MTLTGNGLSERRQQQLLRSYGTHTLDTILIDPDAGISEAKASCRGSSHHYIGDEPPCRMQTRSEGSGFGGDWESPAELLTWGQVKRIAQGVPDDLRDQLRDLRVRWNRHQSAYPRFTAGVAAAGCGPLPKIGPLTERQTRYTEELAEWESSGLEQAWTAERLVIETERARLHDLAFPLAVSNEPVDLLELLDQVAGGKPQRSAIAPPEVAARQALDSTQPRPQRGTDVGVRL